MLAELAIVVGVFQNVGQEFTVMQMPAQTYQRYAHPKAADERRRAMHMMKRSVFAAHGEFVRTLIFGPPLSSVS